MSIDIQETLEIFQGIILVVCITVPINSLTVREGSIDLSRLIEAF
jgi:hypothetical protein